MSEQKPPPKQRIPAASWIDDRAALEAAGVILGGDTVGAHLEGRERAESCILSLQRMKCGDELLVDAIRVSAESRHRRAFLTGFLIRIKQAIAGEIPA